MLLLKKREIITSEPNELIMHLKLETDNYKETVWICDGILTASLTICPLLSNIKCLIVYMIFSSLVNLFPICAIFSIQTNVEKKTIYIVYKANFENTVHVISKVLKII